MKAYFTQVKDLYTAGSVRLVFKGLTTFGPTKERCIELMGEAIAFDLWNNNRPPEEVEIRWDGGDNVEILFNNPNSAVYLGG